MLVTQPTSNVKRIGWSKLVKNPSDLREIYRVRKELSDLNVEKKFSNHLVTSETANIETIKSDDSFFAGILFIDDADQFIDLANTNGEKLEASDIANYILSLNPMTHLKLQKILYIAYERFYHRTGNLLYSNKILAFDYGPVTKDVFNKYYRNRKVLKNDDDDDALIQIQDNAISPSVAKVMLSENGLFVMDIVKEVVTEYSGIDAWDVVKITHGDGTAWTLAYDTFGQNAEITKKIMDESIPI